MVRRPARSTRVAIRPFSSIVDSTQRASLYQQGGWSRFDPNAPAYTDEQIRREREQYRTRM